VSRIASLRRTTPGQLRPSHHASRPTSSHDPQIPCSPHYSTWLWLVSLVRAIYQQCFLDFCVPYTIPRRGHILYFPSPLVVASSIRRSHPKSSLLPAPPQNLPLALRQVRPTATLNNNKRHRPCPMIPREQPQRPHRAQGHLHQSSQRSPQPPLHWRPTRR
jgi:hypothetical protein